MILVQCLGSGFCNKEGGYKRQCSSFREGKGTKRMSKKRESARGKKKKERKQTNKRLSCNKGTRKEGWDEG